MMTAYLTPTSQLVLDNTRSFIFNCAEFSSRRAGNTTRRRTGLVLIGRRATRCSPSDTSPFGKTGCTKELYFEKSPHIGILQVCIVRQFYRWVCHRVPFYINNSPEQRDINLFNVHPVLILVLINVWTSLPCVSAYSRLRRRRSNRCDFIYLQLIVALSPRLCCSSRFYKSLFTSHLFTKGRPGDLKFRPKA